MKRPIVLDPRQVALEVARRVAMRSGQTFSGILYVVRLSDPPTRTEELLLAAVQLARMPIAIMPHKCATMDEWLLQYATV
jgi:hypothetical protein